MKTTMAGDRKDTTCHWQYMDQDVPAFAATPVSCLPISPLKSMPNLPMFVQHFWPWQTCQCDQVYVLAFSNSWDKHCSLPKYGNYQEKITVQEFWSCDLWPWSHDLDLGILVDAPVPKVLMPTWPIGAYWLPIRGRCVRAWKFGPVTFYLSAMT